MKNTKKILSVALLAATCFAVVGCTPPQYGRTVTREYDAGGRLIGTTVTEHVTQMDPGTKPLLKVIKNQTYMK